MKSVRILSIVCLSVVFSIQGCDKNNNVSIFSIEDDKALGADVDSQISNDPEFQILSRQQYPAAYNYLDSVMSAILSSDEVAYRDEFVWEVKIINDDVLNAFAAPGGYLYVYTGLVKYLDNADAFAGVMAHEVAHADLRHTSRTLQRQYGVSFLLQLITGDDASQLEQIAAQIAGTAAGLSFSREFETESDEKSVEYLADTEFACDGAKLFFEKLEAQGQGSNIPEFFSTHPNPDNRIDNITQKAIDESCDTTLSGGTRYQKFQADLP